MICPGNVLQVPGTASCSVSIACDYLAVAFNCLLILKTGCICNLISLGWERPGRSALRTDLPGGPCPNPSPPLLPIGPCFLGHRLAPVPRHSLLMGQGWEACAAICLWSESLAGCGFLCSLLEKCSARFISEVKGQEGVAWQGPAWVVHTHLSQEKGQRVT